MIQLERFQQAADLFVAQEKEKKEVIGIIIAGSMVYDTLDKNSDIDIFIILDRACDFRERGNTWINGVEIEYFKNPPQQVEAYLKAEQKSPHTAHMLANGKVVYQKGTAVEHLIKKAKQLLSAPLPKIKPIEIELAKYHLDDLFKDLEDSQLKGDSLGAALIKHQLLDISISTFCKVHQIYRAKHKRLEQQLVAIDASFAQTLQLAHQPDWQENGAMQALKQTMARLLGGERPKEWILQSPLAL